MSKISLRCCWLISVVFSGLFAIFFAPTTAWAEMIVDGGFENPVLASGGVQAYTPGQSFGGPGGWLSLGNPGTSVGILQTSVSEPGNGMTAFNAHAGFNSFDLTGPYNQGPSLGISETVATVAGQGYLLTFYVGTATPTFGTSLASFYHDPGTVDLSIDGGSRLHFTNTSRTNGFVNWKQFSYEFIASSSTTTISFFNGTAPINNNVNSTGIGSNGSNYVGLDDVSLNSVPVPSSLTMVAGFVATITVAGVIRRRGVQTVTG